jgi:hypothetical protein
MSRADGASDLPAAPEKPATDTLQERVMVDESELLFRAGLSTVQYPAQSADRFLCRLIPLLARLQTPSQTLSL